MLLAADPPGASILKTATTLPELRGWYQQYGMEYLKRLRGNGAATLSTQPTSAENEKGQLRDIRQDGGNKSLTRQ